jgi:UDP-N-acetylmuramate dehydrogenase
MALPENSEQIAFLIKKLTELGARYMIIGNGSNLLFPDEGLRGVIIKIGENFSDLEIKDNVLTAQSGRQLSSAAAAAAEAGLSGMEFASGIPGSVGGGVFMNAGAYDGEIKHIFAGAEVMYPSGEIRILSKPEMNFGYRHSIAMDENLVILSAIFKLTRDERSNIQTRINVLTQKRREKQPIEMPSAGSVFKRPEGYFAGKLISDAGLRGFIIGGAQVSEKHAGFIVNKGGATSDDVRRLINHIQVTVLKQFGVLLQPEIRIIAAEVGK